jgi:hypothetical protein
MSALPFLKFLKNPPLIPQRHFFASSAKQGARRACTFEEVMRCNLSSEGSFAEKP